ncbi:extracellular solute-binding protein [Natrinema halophilum]|nr:extracellular solute-binding protein [Natrinema halophilum]QLG48171.2 extracellular solute-binding protein [Natrinema halophilum]
MQRRSVLKSIGGVAGGAALAGCTGLFTSGGNDAALWHDFTDAEKDTVDGFLEQFNDETDHEIEASSISNLGDQLETALPSNDGPMSFAWAHDWVGKEHEDGNLYDATDDIDVDVDSTYTEVAAGAVRWEDNLYGLPYGAETTALLYNKDLVDEPPETADEMVSIMERVDTDYGIACPGEVYNISGYLQAFGGVLYDAGADDLGVDSDEVVEGLEFARDNIYEHSPEDLQIDGNVSVFQDGNAPFIITGPWNISGFSDAGIDVGVTTLPAPNGGEPTPYTGIQMWYFTSRLGEADDDVFDATTAWGEWYTTTKDVATTNAEEHALIPVLTEVIEGGELSDQVKSFSDSVEMGMAMPANSKMDAVWAPVKSAIQNVVGSGNDPQSELESAAEEIRGNWG